MTNGRPRVTIIITIANALDRCIIKILYARDVRRALLICTSPRDDDK